MWLFLFCFDLIYLLLYSGGAKEKLTEYETNSGLWLEKFYGQAGKQISTDPGSERLDSEE